MSRGHIDIVRSGSSAARGGGGGTGIIGLLLVGVAVAIGVNTPECGSGKRGQGAHGATAEQAVPETGPGEKRGKQGSPESEGIPISPEEAERIGKFQRELAAKNRGQPDLEARFREGQLDSAIDSYEKWLIGKEWKRLGKISGVSHQKMGEDVAKFRITLKDGKGKELNFKPVVRVKFRYSRSGGIDSGVYAPGKAECGTLLFGNNGCGSFPGNELPGVSSLDKKSPQRRKVGGGVPPWKRNVRRVVRRAC